MKKKLKILGIASSLRSKSNEEDVVKQLNTIKDYEHFTYYYDYMSLGKLVSNSEACLIAALFGALREKCDIELVRLRKYFSLEYPTVISKEKEAELISMVESCDGIIIGTPVYFGDRSSYAESFIKLIRERGLLKNKPVGVVSVGAKRNGGQETTNIFTLFEALGEGAIACSNGPKTAQYGGTGWAGDIGSIGEDNFGMDTSIGVGHNVAKTAALLHSGKSLELKNFKMTFWITKDKDEVLKRDIESRIEYLQPRWPSFIEYKILDITKKRLKRCVACDICPYHFDKEKYGAYKDKIQNDDLKDMYEDILDTNAIVIAAYNPRDTKGVDDVYQVFTERTRHIRRDNFALTNTPMMAYSLQETGNNNPFTLKVMTSYIRHNGVLMPPATQYIHEGDRLNNCVGVFDTFVETAMQVNKGRLALAPRAVSYEAVGYAAKGMDKMVSLRR